MARRRPTSFCLVPHNKPQLQLRVPTCKGLGAKSPQTGMIRILAHYTHLYHHRRRVLERSARKNATAQGGCWIRRPSHAARRNYAGASVAAVTAKITAQAGMRTVVAMKWRPTIVRATPSRPRAMATNEKSTWIDPLWLQRSWYWTRSVVASSVRMNRPARICVIHIHELVRLALVRLKRYWYFVVQCIVHHRLPSTRLPNAAAVLGKRQDLFPSNRAREVKQNQPPQCSASKHLRIAVARASSTSTSSTGTRLFMLRPTYR